MKNKEEEDTEKRMNMLSWRGSILGDREEIELYVLIR